ncbi:MAG: 2Fe-2S iron-sulfur cluster-binding protein [Pseudomonadota bacterium]
MRRFQIDLTVDGASHALEVEPRMTLLDVLRDCCGVPLEDDCAGDCSGACTVILGDAPVRSCLMFAVQAHGETITTAFDESSTLTRALMIAFAETGAVRCGGCVPGFVALAAAALARAPNLDDEAIDTLVAGQVCRCGSAQPIARAIRAARDAIRLSSRATSSAREPAL